jgi:hypothetical protein
MGVFVETFAPSFPGSIDAAYARIAGFANGKDSDITSKLIEYQYTSAVSCSLQGSKLASDIRIDDS